MIFVNTNIKHLILLMLLIIFWMNTLKNEQVILIGEKQSKIINKYLFIFFCVYKIINHFM